MRKLFATFAVCLLGLASMAHPKAEILVAYDCTRPDKKDQPVSSRMSLLASPAEAKFFNDLSLWVDSLKSTPDGKARYMDIIKKTCLTVEADGSTSWDLRKGPVKKAYSYIFTNLGKAEYYLNNTESIMNAQGQNVRIYTLDENGNKVEVPKYDGLKLSYEPDYR